MPLSPWPVVTGRERRDVSPSGLDPKLLLRTVLPCCASPPFWAALKEATTFLFSDEPIKARRRNLLHIPHAVSGNVRE